MNLPEKIKQLTTIYQTIKGPKKFVYMSTSITTGPRFFEWYSRVGKELAPESDEYKKLHEKSVINQNIADAKNQAEALYELTGEYIINPAEVDLPLTQEEYMLFWNYVIKNFVSKVVFTPGWELSKGALAEYIIALNSKVPRLNYNLQPITTAEAIKILNKSSMYLTSLGLRSDYQDNILRLLKNVPKI